MLKITKEIKRILTFDLIEIAMSEKLPVESKKNVLDKSDFRLVKRIQDSNILENTNFQLVKQKRKIH